MKKIILLAAFGTLSAAVACGSELAHWNYSGAEGPTHWGNLDPAYAACSSGKSQSPIDLKDFITGNLKPISFFYKAGGEEIVNNGHTVQVNFKDGGSISVDGHVYTLKQFHFHSPSENKVNGRQFPAEAHFVHADAGGHLAVVAVFFEDGAASAALARVLKAAPHNAGEKKALIPAVQADTLMPEKKDYYRFNGSLTTPPCTEGVQWLVLRKPLTASADQIKQLVAVLHHANNRPVQPLNGRKVEQ